MSCFYENNGQYSGITQEIINAIDAACKVEDIFAEGYELFEGGEFRVHGAMSYSSAVRWDEFFQEQALAHGICGSMETLCDGERSMFYLGTPQQQRDIELEDTQEQIVQLQLRVAALQAMSF